MALLIHVGSHPDELVGGVCEELASPPADPFAQEVVAVPTRGIERWLTQQIASGLGDRIPGGGVCANLEMPSPFRLLRRVMAEVPDLADSIEAWDATALTCHVVDALDSHRHEPSMRLLDRYIEAGAANPSGNSQRLRAARKIAWLFGRYIRWRPGMVRDWRAGLDNGPAGTPLPDHQGWQPWLWRMVRDRIGAPCIAELLPDALRPIREGSVVLDLPDRIGVYGLTAADPVDLEVWEALGVRRDVHLYVLHPSPTLWRRTSAKLGRPPAPVGRILRSGDPTSKLPLHPLLRSWAQESREFQAVLSRRRATVVEDRPDGPVPVPSHLLGMLQDDIRGNRTPSPVRDPVDGDRSVQIHACHGDRRQVEVLRDAILHVLSSDPTLEPRDVVIMTPDLATFAPLIEATFLASPTEAGGDPASPDTGSPDRRRPDSLPDLRVRIADRAPAATNPLVRFTATVLALPGARMEAGLVRELLATAVVRRLFEIEEETADGLAALIDDAGISWGIDAEHRQAWRAGPYEHQTWRRGIDRALAGVFYGDSRVRVVGSVAPLDGVEGQDALLVGLLAQIIDRIVAVRALLGVSRPYSEWGPAIAAAVRLLAAPAWDEQWQWGQLERLLEESFPAHDPAGADPEIGPSEARLVIDRWADDGPSPLHFRTGDTTVCTLAPMRSVPYRVVCLLGMDDHRFPRGSRADGDDLLVDHEMVGDPDGGAEDRQLLLDALMAAGDHLVVTYSGRDQRTNSEYPPAVPISELEDALSEMVGEAGLERIVTHHPLQAFSERNFVAGGLGVSGPWGFDSLQIRGAEAVRERPDRVMDRRPLIVEDDDHSAIRLGDLVDFLNHPARRFIRARLGFRIPEVGEIDDDTVATRLGPLEEWAVADRMLAGLLEGYDLDGLASRERGQDSVPPGSLGDPGLWSARERARKLWEAARRIGYDPARHSQFTGTVQAGRYRLEGSIVADPDGSRIDVITPSRLKGKHRLGAFARLAFLTALEPSRPWQAVLIGRAAKENTEWKVTVGKLGATPDQRAEKAAALLSGLVDLYEEGLREPIPLPVETAYIWQRKLGGGQAVAWREARKVWETDYFRPEGDDPAYRLLFPDLAGMDALVASPFPDYARRLWMPILPLLAEKHA